MNMKHFLQGIGVAAAMLMGVNASAHTASPQACSAQSAQDIVERLGATGQFKTLAAALGATDLVSTLQSPGPFTVLAPTDAAFAKLGQSTIDALLANPEQLKSILLYHVVPGQVSLRQALKAGEAATVNGAEVAFKVTKQGFFINDSRILRANVRACNGIVHVIDSVLLPPAPVAKDIVSIALGDDRFETLVAALKAADLVGTLQGEGPFTVFAPTDDAFAKLGQETIEAVLADKALLTDILLYHVVAGASVDAMTAAQLSSATMANGDNVRISFQDGQLKINDSLVIIKDIQASNGIIHVIDTVLIP
jgi:transforming growth factor-beta-induced protein